MTDSAPARDRIVAALLGAIAFAVYAGGACPTIYVGDSGELVAAAYTLGIPHPSGYPLYVLLGKLWTLAVPTGSIAYRMSLFSAAASGSTVAILYAWLRRVSLTPTAAGVGALAFAFSSSFWAEANVQRVYTLNALFLVLMLWLATRWITMKNERALTGAFFVCGLGATNHTFMALATVGLVVIVALAPRATAANTRSRLEGLLRGALAFVLGLLPYLYLPLRSRSEPTLDWGNPETIEEFWRVLSRADFWPRAWIEGPRDLMPILADWTAGIPAEFGWVATILIVLGLASRRLPRPLRAGLVAVAAINVAAVALHGSRSDIFIWHRYYIPSYLVAAAFLAAGCDSIFRLLPARALRTAPVALLIPLVLWAGGREEFDRSRYRIAEDFAERVLASLPPGATLIASDDNILFALLYLHLVEGRRPDVHLVLQGVGKAHLPPLSFDPDDNALYFTHHPNWSVDGLDFEPVGLVFRAHRAGAARSNFSVDARPLDGTDDARVPKDYLTRNLSGHFHYMLGVTLLDVDWPRAAKELARAGEIAPDNDVLFYNLGLVYLRSGLYAEAEEAFARSAAINPRHITGDALALASDRLSEARAERQRVQQVERELQLLLRTARPGDPLRIETSAYHSALADLLAERGETRAALGRRFRAWASRD